MTGRLQLAMTTVGELHVGDLLLLPETPLDNLHTVEVSHLHVKHRSGRITVWARTMPPEQQARSWNYGTFAPTEPIQRVEFR